MTSVILSGGKNTRFPYIKGFIQYKGRTIIENTIETLKGITESVLISTNEPEHYFRFGVPLVGDILQPSGPMTGIFSSLIANGDDSVFVTACDMPFLNPGLIRYIINCNAGDATVPIFNGKVEPLLGVYSRTLIDKMEERIVKGNASLYEMFAETDTKFISESEVRDIDPEGLSFININTEEDLRRHMAAVKEL